MASTATRLTLLDAIKDKNLFHPFFGDSLASWRNWRIALRCLEGIPVKSKYAKDLIRQCTGRNPKKLPEDGFQTAIFLTGRRSGKSRIAATLGAYAAALAGFEKKLSPGESGLVAVVAPTKRQGTIVRNYIRALFDPPMLRQEVTSERQRDYFELRNGNRIDILPGDFRTSRGWTLLAVVVDEICYFGQVEDARVRSDTELVRALEPALATTQGKLIAIGSPYAQRGWAYSMFEKHFGKDDSNVLIWRAPSRTMNPCLAQSVIDKALKEDYAAARSEYLAEWRTDVALFVPPEMVQNLVVRHRFENLRREGVIYKAFIDLSGGRNDASALAIAHREGRKIILDYLGYHPAPNNPHSVVQEMIQTLREWGVRRVTADAFAAEFAAQPFRQAGIVYEQSKKNKSQLYAELLPLLCSGEVELLDNDRLVRQLCGLERRTRSGGRDIIDHPVGQHDDLANAFAGVAVACSAKVIRAGSLGF